MERAYSGTGCILLRLFFGMAVSVCQGSAVQIQNARKLLHMVGRVVPLRNVGKLRPLLLRVFLHHGFSVAKQFHFINAGKKIPKDVAIVFTKIDEVLDTFGFGTVRKPSPHLEAGGFVQEDADEVDREIRNWLKEWGEISFLDAIEANFDSSHVRFFGVSSFGSHPDDNGHPIDVKPHRVLDPLYWMLSLEGVIPIISNETEKEQDESSFEE